MKKEYIISALIVLAIVVFLNLVSSQMFGRIDVTENKQFSLSDVSKDIVRDLDDKVIVKAFFTEDLPAPYNNVQNYTRDLLDEYRAYGGKNIDYEFINPDAEEKIEAEARKYGMQAVQIQAIEKDAMTLKKVYMGIVFLYQDKQPEVIPVIQRIDNLEYVMTSTIKKLTQESLPEIGFILGHGEPDMATGTQQIQSSLEGQYSLIPLQLPAENGIPENMKTLVLMAPQRELDIVSIAQIDQFLMYGGRLAIFLDQYSVEINTQTYEPISHGLTTVLEKYGIRINMNMIGDMQSERISVQRQMGMFKMNVPMIYPFLPKISNFNDDHLITGDLETAVMIFASTLEESQQNTQATFTPLWNSTEKAVIFNDPYDLNPMSYEKINYSDGPYVLAYAGEGVFPSYFEGNMPYGFSSAKPMKIDSDPTRIVVVGDGQFCLDEFTRNGFNLIVFQNIVDWLTSEEGRGLISIRSRLVTERPLQETSHTSRVMLKIINIALAPLLVVIYGLIRWSNRRKRRKMSMEM